MLRLATASPMRYTTNLPSRLCTADCGRSARRSEGTISPRLIDWGQRFVEVSVGFGSVFDDDGVDHPVCSSLGALDPQGDREAALAFLDTDQRAAA